MRSWARLTSCSAAEAAANRAARTLCLHEKPTEKQDETAFRALVFPMKAENLLRTVKLQPPPLARGGVARHSTQHASTQHAHAARPRGPMTQPSLLPETACHLRCVPTAQKGCSSQNRPSGRLDESCKNQCCSVRERSTCTQHFQRRAHRASHPHAFGLKNGLSVVCAVVSGLGGEVTVYIKQELSENRLRFFCRRNFAVAESWVCRRS